VIAVTVKILAAALAGFSLCDAEIQQPSTSWNLHDPQPSPPDAPLCRWIPGLQEFPGPGCSGLPLGCCFFSHPHAAWTAPNVTKSHDPGSPKPQGDRSAGSRLKVSPNKGRLTDRRKRPRLRNLVIIHLASADYTPSPLRQPRRSNAPDDSRLSLLSAAPPPNTRPAVAVQPVTGRLGERRQTPQLLGGANGEGRPALTPLSLFLLFRAGFNALGLLRLSLLRRSRCLGISKHPDRQLKAAMGELLEKGARRHETLWVRS
jgi:hypothetical protein